MKTVHMSVQVLVILFALHSASGAWAGGTWEVSIPTSQPSLTPMFGVIKEIRHAFANYSEARMTLQQREAWANRIAEVCKAAAPSAA